MSKFKRIIEFILALLNFLFHFKSVPDDETPDVIESYPSPVPSSPARADPLFDTFPLTLL